MILVERERAVRENTCCFLGHRKIEVTDELRRSLRNDIENLITKENTSIFLFGSKSQFGSLCYQITTELKAHYPQIKRVYVRAEFPNVSDDYEAYLLQSYEETYFPPNMIKAGKAAYVERNCEMIDKSKFCIMYFDKNYMPTTKTQAKSELSNYKRKSGTKIAYEYALKKQKIIINIFEEK